jgi:hypothetical protein
MLSMCPLMAVRLVWTYTCVLVASEDICRAAEGASECGVKGTEADPAQGLQLEVSDFACLFQTTSETSSSSVRAILLPQEILDLVCSYLHTKNDIQSARLASRAFHAAADPLLRDPSQRPSLLFGNIQPDLFTTKSGPFTLWTWLDFSPDITIEDETTGVGQKFKTAATAMHHYKEHSSLPPTLNDGARAICWGRLKESPKRFCIITCEPLRHC